MVVVPGFGWSAGDIAAALKIIWKVIEGFEESKGARKKYSDSLAFLNGLDFVFRRLPTTGRQNSSTTLVNGTQNNVSSFPNDRDIVAQANIIRTAYDDFEAYLLKRSKVRDPSSLLGIWNTIRWTMDDMNGDNDHIFPSREMRYCVFLAA